MHGITGGSAIPADEDFSSPPETFRQQDGHLLDVRNMAGVSEEFVQGLPGLNQGFRDG
jgi:hypothetical protein